MTVDAMTLQSGDSETGFLRRAFPGQIDNNYRGYRVGLWLFGFYVLVKLAQGAESVFNTYSTAMTADGLPLPSYSPAVAQTVLSMFALLGLNLMVLPLLGVLALVRYRAMIPLICLMMLVLNLSGRAVQLVHAIPRAGGVEPIGFYVNLVLLAVLLIGFALSLARPASPERDSAI